MSVRPRLRKRLVGERGTATAEVAVLLPALVLVTALCLWGLAAAAVHLRCLDAARAGARELARGESEATVREVSTARAPEGAQVELVDRGAGLVGVEVRAPVALPGGWAGPGITVGGEAVAAVEEGVVPGG